MLLALGDFRRNLLEGRELRGILCLGGLGRFGAGRGPQQRSESSGPGDFPRSRGLKSTGSGVAEGAGRQAVIAGVGGVAGMADSGSAVGREGESFSSGDQAPAAHVTAEQTATLTPARCAAVPVLSGRKSRDTCPESRRPHGSSAPYSLSGKPVLQPPCDLFAAGRLQFFHGPDLA